MRRVLVGFALASFAAGLAASAFWLRYGDTSGFAATPLWVAGVSLATLCALSAVSLAVRWLRWHFLLRRTIATLPTQTSVKLYFATLPAFATPLYLGELIRTALAARRVPHARVGVFAIWAVERLADAATLGAFLLAAQGRWGPLALLAAAGFGAVAAVRSSVQNPTLRALSSPQVLTALGLSSATCWAMPILGLWIAAGQLGEPITPTAATQVFSLATLLGGISMLPLLRGDAKRVHTPTDPVCYELAGSAAVFRGDYKLMRNNPPFGDKQWRLFRYTTDPLELDDLSAANPKLLGEMTAAYKSYAKAEAR